MSELFLTDRANKVLPFLNMFHIFTLPLLVYLLVVAIKLVLRRESLRTLWALMRLYVWSDIRAINLILGYINILLFLIIIMNSLIFMI